MLRDSYLLQGAAVLIAIDAAGPLNIRELTELHTSAYQFARGPHSATVLFKIATSRAGRHRWQFTVGPGEVELIKKLHGLGSPLFMALVCQKDGVCCLTEDDLFQLISKSCEVGQALSVSREPRGSYWVNGPAKADLNRSVPISDWPAKLFQTNR